MTPITFDRSAGEAWDVAEVDFPQSGTAEEKLAFLVRYAVLAPSTRNTQPWLFAAHDGVVDVMMDERRALAAIDPDQRELVMSCGAAAFNLQLAMRHFGCANQFTAFPDPADPTLTARISLVGAARPSVTDDLLFHAIKRRRTYRHSFLKQALPDSLIDQLKRDARRQGARMRFVENGPERDMMAKLIADAEYRQMRDARSRGEILGWLRTGPNPKRDGVPGYALGSMPHVSRPSQKVSGTSGLTEPAADCPYAANRCSKLHCDSTCIWNVAKSAPALAVLETTADRPEDWLRAGQALEKALLRCAAGDVYVSYLNQPIEVADLRPQVARLIGTKGFPQLILRMGFGAEARPTPRRPVEDVLLFGRR